MASSLPTAVLREQLLEGRRVALASTATETLHAPALVAALRSLGASVAELSLARADSAEAEESDVQRQTAAALQRLGGLDALVLDGAGLFGTDGGHEALVWSMGACWSAARAAAEQGLIPASAGGRIVLLAPAPDAGEHAQAALAALENLARTLSIEWARHRITTIAVAPGSATDAQTLHTLVAYLLSPAGAYFSGCLLDLRRGVS